MVYFQTKKIHQTQDLGCPSSSVAQVDIRPLIVREFWGHSIFDYFIVHLDFIVSLRQ